MKTIIPTNWITMQWKEVKLWIFYKQNFPRLSFQWTAKRNRTIQIICSVQFIIKEKNFCLYKINFIGEEKSKYKHRGLISRYSNREFGEVQLIIWHRWKQSVNIYMWWWDSVRAHTMCMHSIYIDIYVNECYYCVQKLSKWKFYFLCFYMHIRRFLVPIFIVIIFGYVLNK